MKMKQIQEKIGTNPDGIFGRYTAKAIMEYCNLSIVHASHFIGQCHHESGGFRVFEENLNYSHVGLFSTFRKYFPKREDTHGYAYNPEKIANKVYANRMGNGDEESGDGWRYRGRGAIQLTGKKNYQEFSLYESNLDIYCNPDLVATRYQLESAMFYFERNGIFKYCNDLSDSTITKVSKHINVGNPNSSVVPHGLKDRINKTKWIHGLLTS